MYIMYQSLYRKYRPDSFEKVIGQDHITKTLVNQIKSGNIAHAYLLTGTRGTGKTSVARIFARAINCLSPRNGSPCGECECCKKLLSGTSLDVVEIDAASNNSVDDARAIRDNVRYAPVDCKYKVYIIDEVHQLSGAAFNALLKTLEEPPAHAVFILATTEVQKIPATIMSRCLRLDFHLVPQETLERHVAKIFDLEGVKYTPEGISAIAAAGEGSVRDTLSVADMCVSYSDIVDYESVLGVLGANDPTMIAKISYATLAGDVKSAIDLVEEAASLGKSVQLLTRDLTKYFRDLIIIKHDPACNSVLKLPARLFDAAADIARAFDAVVLMRALDIFSGIEAKSRYSNQPKILLETAIIKTATLSGEDLTDLISRVTQIEGKIKEMEALGGPKPEYKALKNLLSIPTNNHKESAPLPNPSPMDSVIPDTVPEFDPASAVEALPFDIDAPAPMSQEEAPAIPNTLPTDFSDVQDHLPDHLKNEMLALRGRILNLLRFHPMKMLYINLGGNPDGKKTQEEAMADETMMSLCDGKIIIAFKNESNYNYCNTPANIAELKKVISMELGSPVDVVLVNCSDNARDRLTISDLVKLFSGAEKIKIENYTTKK